jgi:hypothetical protein
LLLLLALSSSLLALSSSLLLLSSSLLLLLSSSLLLLLSSSLLLLSSSLLLLLSSSLLLLGPAPNPLLPAAAAMMPKPSSPCPAAAVPGGRSACSTQHTAQQCVKGVRSVLSQPSASTMQHLGWSCTPRHSNTSMPGRAATLLLTLQANHSQLRLTPIYNSAGATTRSLNSSWCRRRLLGSTALSGPASILRGIRRATGFAMLWHNCFCCYCCSCALPLCKG